ncbi:MAG: hypothetical protein HOV97_05010 [Nonomuraea sp.]|nr:hypothetical protein [Nonomuraea sp.]
MPGLIPVTTGVALQGPRTCPADPNLFAAYVMDAATGYPSGVWVGRGSGDAVTQVGTWMAATPSRWMSSLSWLDATTLLVGDATAGTLRLLRVTATGVVASTPVQPYPGALAVYLSQYPRVTGTQCQVVLDRDTDATWGVPHALSVATFDFGSGEFVGFALTEHGSALVDTNAAIFGHQVFPTGDILVYGDDKSVFVRSATDGPIVDTEPFATTPAPGQGQTWWTSWADYGYGNSYQWGPLVNDRVWVPCSFYVGTTSELGLLEFDPHTGLHVEHHSGIFGGDPSLGYAVFTGEIFACADGVLAVSASFPSPASGQPYSVVTFDTSSGKFAQYPVVDAAESSTMVRPHGTLAGTYPSGLLSVRVSGVYQPYLWAAPKPVISGSLVEVRSVFTRNA